MTSKSSEGDLILVADDDAHIVELVSMYLKGAGYRVEAVGDGDETLRLALLHLIQVIGEAARNVSTARRDQHPEIPWRLIVGMRHKLVHDYMEVDEDLVWKTTTEDLPGLIKALETIVPDE